MVTGRSMGWLLRNNTTSRGPGLLNQELPAKGLCGKPCRAKKSSKSSPVLELLLGDLRFGVLACT